MPSTATAVVGVRSLPDGDISQNGVRRALSRRRRCISTLRYHSRPFLLSLCTWKFAFARAQRAGSTVALVQQEVHLTVPH